MKGLAPYRGKRVTELKRAAHQSHRARIRMDLRKAAMDPEFDLDQTAYENLDTWDVW